MLAPGQTAGETETRRKASAFMYNLTASVSLLVLGFPVTTGSIRAAVFSWALIAIAIMRFVWMHFVPQGCLAPTTTTHAPINDLKLTSLEREAQQIVSWR